MTNYIKIQTTCPECNSKEIYHDTFHTETWCNQCGLILQDTTIFQITSILTEEQNKNIYLNNFWRKTNRERRNK